MIMKNILALLVIFTISPGVLLAQVVQVSSSSVRDYASFKKYVEFEQSKLTAKPLTIDNGGGRNKLKKMGIEFSPKMNWARSKDKKRLAYLSPDRKGVALMDHVTRSVNILGANGEILRRIPFPPKIEGFVGFSTTRLFDFKGGFGDSDGGFYVYDNAGRLIKKVEDCGTVDVFMVSNNQKYVFVTASLPDVGDFVVMYDMNGVELWRKQTEMGGKTEIRFSLDDEYVLVKMPIYWVKGNARANQLYLFRVDNGELISEEHYED